MEELLGRIIIEKNEMKDVRNVQCNFLTLYPYSGLINIHRTVGPLPTQTFVKRTKEKKNYKQNYFTRLFLIT